MKVGDVIAWPKDLAYDRNLVAIAMRGRGQTARMANRGGAAKNERESKARKIVAEHDEAQRRASDPYELAKIYLGRRGYAVWDRRVNGQSGFQVGRNIVATRNDVLNYARRLGWAG